MRDVFATGQFGGASEGSDDASLVKNQRCVLNRADAVETAWSVIEPLLDIWHATKPFQPFPNYSACTWGPAAADALLARDGRAWHNVVATPTAMPQPNVHVEHAGEPIGARRGAEEGAAGKSKAPRTKK